MNDIHGYFGLSYANYLVMHRSLLQSMPEQWQAQFVAMLEEYDAAFDHVPRAEIYEVRAARVSEYGELTEAERELLSVTSSMDELDADTPEEQYDEASENEVFYDRDGDVHQPWERVLVPTGPDPVPQYERGRARVEPRLDVS